MVSVYTLGTDQRHDEWVSMRAVLQSTTIITGCSIVKLHVAFARKVAFTGLARNLDCECNYLFAGLVGAEVHDRYLALYNDNVAVQMR
jgi:hypothetical protein